MTETTVDQGYIDTDEVLVRFNYPAYVSDEANPFDTNKLYKKANENLAGMEFITRNMLRSKNMIEMGQIVKMNWGMAKKYVEKKYPRNYHLTGEIGTYAADPNLRHEMPLAEIVDNTAKDYSSRF